MLSTNQSPSSNGLLIIGAALARIVPLVFSLAGDTAAGQAVQASATITTISYAGLLVGPVFTGGFAGLVGLQSLLGSVIIVGLAIVLLRGHVQRD